MARFIEVFALDCETFHKKGGLIDVMHCLVNVDTIKAIRQIRPQIDNAYAAVMAPACLVSFADQDEWGVISGTLQEIKQQLQDPTAWVPPSPLVDSLFDAIKHGDQKHQDWLRQAINDHMAGRPVQREDKPAIDVLAAIRIEKDAIERRVEALEKNITGLVVQSEQLRAERDDAIRERDAAVNDLARHHADKPRHGIVSETVAREEAAYLKDKWETGPVGVREMRDETVASQFSMGTPKVSFPFTKEGVEACVEDAKTVRCPTCHGQRVPFSDDVKQQTTFSSPREPSILQEGVIGKTLHKTPEDYDPVTGEPRGKENVGVSRRIDGARPRTDKEVADDPPFSILSVQDPTGSKHRV